MTYIARKFVKLQVLNCKHMDFHSVSINHETQRKDQSRGEYGNKEEYCPTRLHKFDSLLLRPSLQSLVQSVFLQIS